MRRGVAVSGLVAGAQAMRGVPHVTGVRTRGGEEIPADLVVDATGRRSPLPDWLESAGAGAPTRSSRTAGFVYYGRHFRSADGTTPPILGPAPAGLRQRVGPDPAGRQRHVGHRA